MHPQVGVGVVIKHQDKILIGKRVSSHGKATWQFPGGHLEFGEEIFDCAKREVMEETGLTLSDLELGPFTNDIFIQDNKHYITIFVRAKAKYSEIVNHEPDKAIDWHWSDLNDLPDDFFLPIKNLINKHPQFLNF